ncbi:MAG: SDR family NAD(P)-dependent oxidoreductase [Pseudomonadales bacterium]
MSVEGLRFVITGASAGIGAGTARLAASAGAKVVVSDLNDEAGEALVAEIVAAGGEAVYQHCDVTDEDQVKALMAAAAKAFGGIDVLHNNAGIHESMVSQDLSLETMSLATFEKVVSVNLIGVFLCSKYALPFLKESSQASIINAGSTSSIAGYPNCMAYGSTKGAVMQLTKNLAVDLAPYGIRSNCYCPGSIHTQMVDKFLEAAPDPQAMLNTMTMTHLIPRMGVPKDVAELVCFLASEKSQFINGVVWLIDGGSLAWRGTLDILGMGESI